MVMISPNAMSTKAISGVAVEWTARRCGNDTPAR